MTKTNNNISLAVSLNCTLPNLAKVKGAYYVPNNNMDDFLSYAAMEEKRMIRNGYHYKRTATHNGYLPQWYVAVIPYSGRWGNGYIVASHLTDNKVQYDYYIKGQYKWKFRE